MKTRSEMASAYGMPPDSSWDNIYEAWKRYWRLQTHMPKILAYSAVIPAIVLILSQHWLAVVTAAVLFGAGVSFLVMMFYLSMEQEYHHLLHVAPGLLNRAKRDGIFD